MKYAIRYGRSYGAKRRHKHYGLFSSKKSAKKALKRLTKKTGYFNPRIVKMKKH